MKGKALLAVAAAALAVAVPTAAGADVAPDWFERAAAAAERDSGTISPYLDAFERPGSSVVRTDVAPAAPDSFERTAIAATQGSRSYRDAHERPGVSTLGNAIGTSVAASDSGSNVAWSQLGIAFLLGLALALGLFAVTRLRPSRPAVQ
jgi:hypothetical protein